MLGEYLKIVVENLRHRRLRSYLTMLGIIIGIAAVVSLISLGQGLEEAVLGEFQDLGTDRIVISPLGTDFGPTDRTPTRLSTDDLDVVRRVRGVDEASSIVIRTAQVTWGRSEQGTYFVIGYELDDSKELVENSLGLEIIDGQGLRQTSRGQAIVGYDYQNFRGFDDTLRVGDRFEVGERRFRVSGVNRRLGNEIDDRTVFLGMQDFKTLFDVDDEVSNIIVRVESQEEPSVVATRIEDELRSERGVDEGNEDFEVDTFQELLESFTDIFDAVQVVVVGIAAISLVVGGIGIMNTMYTSVLERRKEIGIMKSIGARNRDVYTIFLLESGLLGLIGGLIGIVLGLGFAYIVQLLGMFVFDIPMLNMVISLNVIGGALLFSVVVGVLSGLLPSRQAANVNPVDALKSE